MVNELELKATVAMVEEIFHRDECKPDCIASPDEPGRVASRDTIAKILTLAAPSIAAGERERIAVAAEQRGLIHFAADVAHGKV